LALLPSRFEVLLQSKTGTTQAISATTRGCFHLPFAHSNCTHLKHRLSVR